MKKFETTHSSGEPANIEQGTTAKQGDVPALNVLQMGKQENLSRRSSISEDNGKSDKHIVGKNEAEKQGTDVVERGEHQGDNPYTEEQITEVVDALNKSALETIQKRYGEISAATEEEMGKAQLEEQDKVFKEYIDALGKEPLDSPAIEAAREYVFKSIDESAIKMHIAEGGEGKKPTEQVEALKAMRNGDPQEYAASRERLRADMTGKFHSFGFTALGDLEEDNPDGCFYNDVTREHIQGLVTSYLESKLDNQ